MYTEYADEVLTAHKMCMLHASDFYVNFKSAMYIFFFLFRHYQAHSFHSLFQAEVHVSLYLYRCQFSISLAISIEISVFVEFDANHND